jgi:hypothetical protein
MPNLQYTFLGSEKNPQRGTYTPLIVPGTLGQEIKDIDTSTDTGTSQNPDTGATQVQQNVSNVTPFSKIKNYIVESIKSGKSNYVDETTVNILNDYFWTISPKNSKIGSDSERYKQDNFNNVNDEVPYILLKERYFLINNIVAQALYTLSSSLDVLGQNVFNTIKEDLEAAGQSLRRNFVETRESVSEFVGQVQSPTFNTTSQAVRDAAQGALDASGLRNASSNTASNVSNSILKTLDAFGAQDLLSLVAYDNPDLEDVLFPYNRLYIVGNTGFNYKIPYLNPSILNVNNNFSDQSEQNLSGVISELVGTATNVAELLGGTANILSQAGSSKIERAKNFQYPTSGSPIDVVFPLYNTRPASFDDICNNFKLVMLLLYQNLPLRQDKIIVEPPVMYDVTIPGNRREPYCYISSLTINYKGATRLMDIPTTGLESVYDSTKIAPFIKTIIPDMYEVRLQLQPMVASTKNLLFTQLQDPVVKFGYQDVQSVISPNSFDLGPTLTPGGTQT